MILPAFLLSLEEYSFLESEGGGGGGGFVPIIRSAVRTTLRSNLVAELNQTVIDMQRMDSMMAEQNCFSSSCGMLNEGSTASAGPFLQWTQCDCPTSDPEKLWCPRI